MQAILEDHLSLTVPPAMFDLYSRIIDLFEAYDVEDYQLSYDDILCSADGAVDGVSVADNDAIYRQTMDFAKQILREHQITLSDDATMLQYYTVLDFIKQIERTELVEECYAILLDDNTDNLDKFGKCLFEVSGVIEEDSMLFLSDIPDCVIEKMKYYFSRRVELEVSTETLDASVKDVYREMDKFIRIVQGQEMRSAKYLFDEDGCIGMPFEQHFKQNQDYLLELLLEAMLYECIGFALISENGLENPEKTIIAVLGEYISDLDRLTVIQYELSKILINYRNEISSGVGIIQ